MWSARSIPAAASRSSAIRTTGGATLRSTAGCGTSTRSVSTSIATPIRILEAFTKGLYDIRVEMDPSRWETAYDVPAVRDGRIVKEAFPNGLPKQFSGLVFNTRRPIFADVRVREALGLLLDFEWLNHNFFYERLPSARRAISRIPSCRRAAAPRRSASARCSSRFPNAVRADIMEGDLAAAGDRRLRPRPHHAQARARASQGRRLRPRRHGAALAHDAAAVQFRNSGHHRRTRSGWRLPIARDLKRAGIVARVARGRCRAIRPAATHLRLRHDRIPLGPIAVAGQRAGVLLGLRRRRCGRHAKLHGRQKRGDRRH